MVRSQVRLLIGSRIHCFILHRAMLRPVAIRELVCDTESEAIREVQDIPITVLTYLLLFRIGYIARKPRDACASHAIFLNQLLQKQWRLLKVNVLGKGWNISNEVLTGGSWQWRKVHRHPLSSHPALGGNRAQ